ncbi:MAG: peptidase C11 [Firmicutes bacterium]|nr:peptidase C11 [Bacillota bacterium]
MSNQRPRGRDRSAGNSSNGKPNSSKNGTGGVYKRGSGLGTGPVGKKSGYSGRFGSSSHSSSGSSGSYKPHSTSSSQNQDYSRGNPFGSARGTGTTRGALPTGCLGRIIPILIVIVVGYFLIRTLFGGSGKDADYTANDNYSGDYQPGASSAGSSSNASSNGSSSNGTSSSQGSSALEALMNAYGGYTGSYGGNGSISGGWTDTTAANPTLNTSVDGTARGKYTNIVGGGQDKVTIMVYMCGTDLESKSGMATADLSEMAAANISDNVNVIVYTGGCKGWRNSIISNSVNQIYQVKNGGVSRLVENAGAGAMTSPDTLTEFINFCTDNFPANRQMLIFWDHGGGSVSGYGYDEKNPRISSMTLSGINTALKNAGTTFDVIGFDCCLMATAENALMLNSYGDYMIASEETEPGVGWYYTNWLSALSQNTSMPTVELGQRIVDDFVTTCASKCRGQSCTLSVVDLAELSATLPNAFTAFSEEISELLTGSNYQQVSDARSGSREYAVSSKIDQIDLVHFAQNLGTAKGAEVAGSIRNAVKYNRTSSNMTNSYGLSIYFPYKKTSYVDRVVKTYSDIGMDASYSRCIQQFAKLEASGQIASGGTSGSYSSMFGSLLGDYGAAGASSYDTQGGSYTYPGSASFGGLSDLFGGTDGSSSMIESLLGSFLGGSYGFMDGLDSSNTGFFDDRSISESYAAEYVSANWFDGKLLQWNQDESGNLLLRMPESQWAMVHSLELGMFVDDGEGFIDLGLDNICDFTQDGALICDTQKVWLGIDGQAVAYYHETTTDDGENYTITGRVPCYVNDVRSELIIVFDNEHPAGYVAGVRPVYVDDETETIAKPQTGLALAENSSSPLGVDVVDATVLQPGDVIDFICDYYSYEGSYQESYYLGDQMVVPASGELTVENVDLSALNLKIAYVMTDIYNQEHWTESVSR